MTSDDTLDLYPAGSPSVSLRLTAARALGCDIECLDPETRYIYRVSKGQRAFMVFGCISPLNNQTSARISQDKFHTHTIAARAGFRVPETVRCLRPGQFEAGRFEAHLGLEPALKMAAERGYPLLAKPNRGSRGRHVNVVRDEAALVSAVETIWGQDSVALVQQCVPGMDLRLDVLDGTLLVGYVRRPVVLVGDGVQSIRALLAGMDQRYQGAPFWKALVDDPIWKRVTSGRWGPDSVLALGQRVDFGSVVLNLNRLCTAQIFTQVPERWLEACRRLAKAMDLRHVGIDFKVARSADPLGGNPQDAVLLEVNASPGLASITRMGHGHITMPAEKRLVEAMLNKG